MTNDDLNVEMKTKIIKDFLEKWGGHGGVKI